MSKTRPIYLDYHATTPTDPRVVDAMLPWFTERFGNPHSADHAYGWEADDAVSEAREQIAALVGGRAKDVVFTSGATESNNIAVKGAARKRKETEGRTGVVTVVTEHKCVLESARRLEKEGFDVTFLPVDSDGLVDLDDLGKAVSDNTALVSVMIANNEIGTLQKIQDIAGIAHDAGAWLHTDAAQALGKIDLNVKATGIDLMSLSGHKVYGPKGVGALYLNSRKVSVEPLFDGGGQEKGIRPGTVPPALCVGFGKACELAAREMSSEAERLSGLRERLLDHIRSAAPDIAVNGDGAPRLPGNLSVTFPGIDTEELIAALPGLSVSAGSACSSGSKAASHVLQAIGHDPAAREATLRFGLGRFTTEEEIDAAGDQLAKALTDRTSDARKTAERR
ncbi:MAG: cysteine desulfurase family protein [Alphaproteobacteria bacterium]